MAEHVAEVGGDALVVVGRHLMSVMPVVAGRVVDQHRCRTERGEGALQSFDIAQGACLDADLGTLSPQLFHERAAPLSVDLSLAGLRLPAGRGPRPPTLILAAR